MVLGLAKQLQLFRTFIDALITHRIRQQGHGEDDERKKGLEHDVIVTKTLSNHITFMSFSVFCTPPVGSLETPKSEVKPFKMKNTQANEPKSINSSKNTWLVKR
jgi:hypothetical protein